MKYCSMHFRLKFFRALILVMWISLQLYCFVNDKIRMLWNYPALRYERYLSAGYFKKYYRLCLSYIFTPAPAAAETSFTLEPAIELKNKLASLGAIDAKDSSELYISAACFQRNGLSFKE